MLEQIVLLSSALAGYGEGVVELPLSEAIQVINGRLSNCFAAEGNTFDAESHCRPIFDAEDKVIGFETRIDGHPLAFDLNGYSIGPSEATDFFASGSAEMTALSDLVSMNGFNPLSCVCQIPTLVSLCGSSLFGNWETVSFASGTDNCAQIAAMDLLYSYRFTNLLNPTLYSTSADLYNALGVAQNYQPGLGIALSDFLPGLNSVLTSSYYATNGLFDATKPVVCAYSPVTGDIGHFAMKIGEAETTAFWFIKTHWDIVVTRNSNYYGQEPSVVDHQNETCFFGIESNRRQATFVLFGC